jgi:hypothetical protein
VAKAAILFLIGAVCGVGLPPADGQTITFSGYDWQVKSGEKLGPGPNAWDASNVWVDEKGRLHLKISHRNGLWACAEVSTTRRFGFGTYQFQVVGRVDQLDRNVVLGLFNYPPRTVGPDGTNEIDIEFARWGQADAPNGNYTVWPAKPGVKESGKTFRFTLTGEYTTQRFTWKSRSILLQSLHGHRDDNDEEFGRWLFHPGDYVARIPQQPMPVLINLWLFRGKAPTDGKEVEIILQNFKFTPE